MSAPARRRPKRSGSLGGGVVHALRAGEAVSSAIAESAVNQVVSKRMVKKQQMRWSPRGAHLLLQVRTRVLNDDLAADFARWYPTSPAHETDQIMCAA